MVYNINSISKCSINQYIQCHWWLIVPSSINKYKDRSQSNKKINDILSLDASIHTKLATHNKHINYDLPYQEEYSTFYSPCWTRSYSPTLTSLLFELLLSDSPCIAKSLISLRIIYWELMIALLCCAFFFTVWFRWDNSCY